MLKRELKETRDRLTAEYNEKVKEVNNLKRAIDALNSLSARTTAVKPKTTRKYKKRATKAGAKKLPKKPTVKAVGTKDTAGSMTDESTYKVKQLPLADLTKARTRKAAQKAPVKPRVIRKDNPLNFIIDTFKQVKTLTMTRLEVTAALVKGGYGKREYCEAIADRILYNNKAFTRKEPGTFELDYSAI